MQGHVKKKISYFLNSALKLTTRTGLTCPSCGCRESALVKRKYLVSALKRCSTCKLLFRIPTTSEAENEKFYQRAYQQGFTTQMPPLRELEQLKSRVFKNTEKDYTDYIEVLKAMGLKPGTRLLDYGCSWGYGSWQLQQAGYSVQAYEISRPRCEYAKKYLGVDATWNIYTLNKSFDIFFSAHVLEHVPSATDLIAFAEKVLKSKGWFVAFTPNGSDAFRKAYPRQWQRSWGLVHPNLLDEEYYRRAFRNTSFFIASSPYNYNAIAEWAENSHSEAKQKVLSLIGNELLCIAKAVSS